MLYSNVEEVLERFRELQSDREELLDAKAEYQKLSAEDNPDTDKLRELLGDIETLTDNFDQEEYVALKDTAEELEGCDELIESSYFKDYTRDTAESCYTAAWDDWPFSHIDWDAAAEALALDYSEITIDGIDYLYR